ncbi:hypothetical protein R3P38DRAFT_2526691 [Favolaschia claudopus]|uniref:Uncharacterized protein n=1 Tax=Favolaschia claudopus TaxID=2862362 RepID=A0AAW0BL27_9AGAR
MPIPPGPPQFSICDINLQREVYSNDLRVCFRRNHFLPRDVVRRYHTAKVKDQKEMTVVVYEGQDAKEELKRDVAKYMKFRHPSFFQLYGTVHSGNIYATIFYDVLIPWRDIERIYQQSPIVFCYIYAYAASAYFRRRFGSGLYSRNITVFLRPSTGRLCIDLEGLDMATLYFTMAANIDPMSLLSIDTQIVVDALTIEQYHKICYRQFRNVTHTQFPLTATAHLGAVYHTTGHYDLGNPVATAPTLDIDDCLNPSRAWYLDEVDPHITESGWNRFAVSELIGRGKIEFYTWVELRNSDLWLSQANHILGCPGVSPDTDNYALLTSIWFQVELDPQSAWQTDWHSFDAFLFLCPAPQSIQVSPASFNCPECVGYWSFDPLGEDRLSSEQVAELGFPTIHVSFSGYFETWSNMIYAGLRQFHQGKGFDPDSQDIARYLGYPLYQLSSDHDDSMNVDGESIHHIDIPASYIPKRKYAR